MAGFGRRRFHGHRLAPPGDLAIDNQGRRCGRKDNGNAFLVVRARRQPAKARQGAGLRRSAASSYAEGFSGMLAIHPSQVPVINEAFTPGEAEIARARAIVNAFSANPGAGALSLDGQMIDQPHLDQARRLLERLR